MYTAVFSTLINFEENTFSREDLLPNQKYTDRAPKPTRGGGGGMQGKSKGRGGEADRAAAVGVEGGHWRMPLGGRESECSFLPVDTVEAHANSAVMFEETPTVLIEVTVEEHRW
jgi:hypothetical protein